MPTACVAHVGSSAWDRLPEALRLLRDRFGRVPVYPAGDPGDAETLAAELAPEVDVLVVFGGDGTVHEVANGLPLAGDGPLIALLPAGTGNDLARAIGIPARPGGRGHRARPGPAGVPPTCSTAGRGGPPTASTPGSRPPPPRCCRAGSRRPSARRPTWSAGSGPGLNPPTWPARVEVGDRVVEGEALAVVVGNGGSFGGGRWLLPDADVGDGLLDVLVVPAGVSKASLARHLARDRRLPARPAPPPRPLGHRGHRHALPPRRRAVPHPRVGHRHPRRLAGPRRPAGS